MVDGRLLGAWNDVLRVDYGSYYVFDNIEVKGSSYAGMRVLHGNHVTVRHELRPSLPRWRPSLSRADQELQRA